jgi:hypothetical protein
MNTLKSTKILVAIFMVAAIFAGCDTLDFEEADKTYQGDVLVKFNSEEATLFAEEEEDVQNVGVSTLRPVSESRTYSVTVVDSLSTAEEGVHYTLGSNTFTIAANEVLGNFPITLIKENLGDAPKLALSITSDEAASYNSTVIVTLRQFFPYVQEEFVGDYELVYPWWFGDSDPRVVAVEADPEDENILIVVNMLGSGTNIELNMDNSDKTNFTVSFDRQEAWVSSVYGPARMFGSGSFDAEFYVIEANATHTVAAGSFGTNPFTLTKIQN